MNTSENHAPARVHAIFFSQTTMADIKANLTESVDQVCAPKYETVYDNKCEIVYETVYEDSCTAAFNTIYEKKCETK